jgi:hypothetical protein
MSRLNGTFYPVAPLPDTNARQPTMQIRNPSTSLLCIDSEDRNQSYTVSRSLPSTPYTFNITKSESIMNGFFTRLGVTEVVLPWVIPNINPKTAQISITVQVGGGANVTRTLVLNPSFLKPSELAAVLQAGIRTLYNDTPTMAGFTMVYGALPVQAGGNALNNSNVPAFEYNTNNGTTLIAFQPVPYNTAAYPFPTNTKQLFDILGFFNVENTTLAQIGTGGLTYCTPIRYVDVICNQLTYNQALKDAMSQTVVRDTLCRIYVSSQGNQSTVSCTDPTFCPPGCAPTTIYRDFASPKLIQWLPNQPVPGYLSFQLLDDTGAPLDESDAFSSGANKTDWSLTLQVTEN